jgi:pantetheine-phosphate adenylyltransferase
MSKAIYAFSGDPITFRHIDVIERAAAIFQHLIVGIGVNPLKKYLFDLDERSQLAKSALSHLSNVTVLPFTGMLTDFAYEQNVSVIIRGLRNTDDFNFEMTFYQINENQKLNVDTVFIPTRSDMSHISSGAAKAVQLEHGIVKDYVPMIVKQQLEWKISGQVLLGVTGTIASGKSTFCKSFQSKFNVAANHIDMDEIGKEILFGLETPANQRIRQEIKELIGMRPT